MGKKFRYIYGPVPSWRLGRSLGIDPISAKGKVCSFDCIYCQIGATKVKTDKRSIYVATPQIIEELDSLPQCEIDYITFAGAGEPTLAENIGSMIRGIKRIRKEKIAVLTNTSLLNKEEVRKDLLDADFVVAKLDAVSQDLFKLINQPVDSITIEEIIHGIIKFREMYKGRFALQIMLIEQNKNYAHDISQIAKHINPDEIQINTPLRPCGVKPLSKSELGEIENYFTGLNTVSVYKAEHGEVEPISSKDTLRRRGKKI